MRQNLYVGLFLPGLNEETFPLDHHTAVHVNAPNLCLHEIHLLVLYPAPATLYIQVLVTLYIDQLKIKTLSLNHHLIATSSFAQLVKCFHLKKLRLHLVPPVPHKRPTLKSQPSFSKFSHVVTHTMLCQVGLPQWILLSSL